MAKIIVGLMDTQQQARNTVEDLIKNDFNRNSIGLITHERGREMESGRTQAAQRGEGTTRGTAMGGMPGLVGSREFEIRGIGYIIAAGPIAMALEGTGTATVAGGLVGALTQMGVPQEDANFYTEGVRRGGFLITITTDDASADRAGNIMRNNGAVDIDKRAARWKQEGWHRFDANAVPYTEQQMAKEREIVLPVVEEQVEIGKRQVQQGAVRVYTHVVEQPVEEQVRLREERARVERRPSGRPATAAEREAFRETSFEVTETKEEPVISKQARVKEEVVMGKEAAERTETIREKARKTEVEVQKGREQRPAGATVLSPEDEDFQTHFRSFYAKRGEDFDTYRSAYHYAETASQERRFQGKEWPDVEEDVHRDWDKNHPGTWSKMKDAIHYGWDRIHRH